MVLSPGRAATGLLSCSSGSEKRANPARGSTLLEMMRELMINLALLAALACGSNGTGPGSAQLATEVVASGLTDPLYLTAPAGDSRLFVVEQSGRIRVIANGTLSSTPFLDLTSAVGYGGERGLLSVAFHPSLCHERVLLRLLHAEKRRHQDRALSREQRPKRG